MQRAVVDLPHPDSPTRPSVSPRLIENETSWTAETLPARRDESTPCSTGNSLQRLRTSRTRSSPFSGAAAVALSCAIYSWPPFLSFREPGPRLSEALVRDVSGWLALTNSSSSAKWQNA